MATWEEVSTLLDVILVKLERVKTLQAEIGADMEVLREKTSGLTMRRADLFRAGVICPMCQKEGHYGDECPDL